MNLHTLIFTENACYKAGKKIKPKGIMVHSTGANNPWLKRYVGPDDGLLGKNAYNNHWNQPMSRNVCVHGFIGKLADGTIATYQTLPWDHRGWHGGGDSNNTHISFEICEDGLNDAVYFDKVYGLAQWTYWSRKEALLNYALSKKKSIGDYQMQLDFLYKELSENYKAVLSDLKNATSVLAASNSVLTKFERPADQSETVQAKRAGFGQKYYDKYADKPIEEVPDDPVVTLKFKTGDIVKFDGGKHYTSANSTTGSTVKASKVKITAIYKTGKHPYHCRAVNDSGAYISGVYGWVDEADLAAIEAPKPATTTIKKGDVVTIAKNATYYSGKDVPDWVVAKKWIVAEAPVGDRVVINKSTDGKSAINSPINAKFLTVVKANEPWTPKVGDIVIYNGNKHYPNANANGGSTCKGGRAKITNIYQLGKSKHPYHLVRVSGKGATVYGWVDAGTFTKA